MSLDVIQAALVAGGEPFLPVPFSVEGLCVRPPSQTNSSQVTGDDVTTLRGAYTSGRVRLVDYAKDFASGEENVIVSVGGQYDDGTGLANGYAVWGTLVAVQHRPAAAISLMWVMGSVALVASAVVPTVAEVQSAIGYSAGQTRYVILGDLLWHRSADTVITHRTSDERRPAYVDEANKTGLTLSQDDQASMNLKFFGIVPVANITLATISAATAGNLVVDGLPLPKLPYGGKLGAIRYIPSVDAAGAGATVVLRPQVGGTALTGGDLSLDENSDTPAVVSGDGSYTNDSAAYFAPGDEIDIELESKANAFTAGSGLLVAEIWECVA